MGKKNKPTKQQYVRKPQDKVIEKPVAEVGEIQDGFVKLFFYCDQFYNDPTKPLYEAGKTYDVKDELGMVGRWLKRGAVIVEPGQPLPTLIEKPVDSAEKEDKNEMKLKRHFEDDDGDDANEVFI